MGCYPQTCAQSCFHARQEVKLRVSGMHCSACSTAVEAALGALPGVRSAAVSLTMQQADVVRAPGGASEVGLAGPQNLGRRGLSGDCAEAHLMTVSATVPRRT